MVSELLLEIGTEEIPSGYLRPGLNGLERLVKTCLEESRIAVAGGLYSFGTPRRLILIGKAISDKQEDLVREVLGPPMKVAYDNKGKPTKAAIGFAERQGVSIEELQSVKTPKGEYLFIKRKTLGRHTRDILVDVLPDLIKGIPWPKSMRWGKTDFPFARPIHWVLALFNGEVISFEVAGVRSGNITRGHRFMAPEFIEIAGVQEYLEKMERSFVLIDQREREGIVESAAKKAAQMIGGVPADDHDLVAMVANLVEYPSAVCGRFDEIFLDLPDPVLITAMKEHQKYFAVYDGTDKLMPNFIAVNNTVARDESVVRRGHERVLRARLSDANFFFKEDIKRPLVERIEDLKGVIYQAELGTSYAKVQRFIRLAEYLCKDLFPDKIDEVKLAASLCKCDLVTQMVNEFPSLQGVVGKEYAMMEGYPEDVCMAVYEHYLPTSAYGQLPASKIGAIVGLADRMDTIVGCFAIGLMPSGNTDPFALRRHALAIIRIIEEMGWDLSIRDFIDNALVILHEKVEFDIPSLSSKVINFFRERYKQRMLRSGYESDFIEAVISVEFDRINQLRLRIEQLKRFASESHEFSELALTSKRVNNILKKQKELFEVDPRDFKDTCELALWEIYQVLKDDVYECIERKAYSQALDLMAGLRKPVDDFFDGAEVLVKDNRTLRENRIGLLQHIGRLFLSIADFSKFSI